MWAAALAVRQAARCPGGGILTSTARTSTACSNPLSLFAREIPWNTAHFEPAPVSLIAATPLDYAPLRLNEFDRSFPGAVAPDAKSTG